MGFFPIVSYANWRRRFSARIFEGAQKKATTGPISDPFGATLKDIESLGVKNAQATLDRRRARFAFVDLGVRHWTRARFEAGRQVETGAKRTAWQNPRCRRRFLQVGESRADAGMVFDASRPDGQRRRRHAS